ncbi:hypothetical protein [Amycolatopsis saalfeldensis]|uniref:Excreted virulence factor EspC, type VII ESX diderm n=1 Tax=Amycolatopsis saalfeldensis TaxID=394193 RepID=A0A1H8W115_9PSEU|nr:hypothetical protein [Amycolatopsis saalfeldensis]SEP21300.1 hypothetical protein SAMN04489732_104459 [Amycolatopsis saalfeldensis]
MDGPGFHVDVGVLEAASKNMKDLWHGQDDFELRGLCGEPELYGHGGVHDALADFCGQWSVGLDALCDRANGLADTLGKAAQAYRAVEHGNTAALKVDPGTDAVTPDPPMAGY